MKSVRPNISFVNFLLKKFKPKFKSNNKFNFSNIYGGFDNNNNSHINYEIVEPIYPKTNVKRYFPPDILKPDYADTGMPQKHTNSEYIKSIDDIKKIWNSCKIAKNILMTTGNKLKIGMKCEDIDDIVYELCLKHKCYPSPLNYSNFPKCVTTSINNIAVHGIPDQRPLKNGDIISIDVSIYHNGFHGDCCHTFLIGNCDNQAKHLVNVAQLCLYESIKICKHGQLISSIGKTIEQIANKYDMGVIREFCGHGVGKDLHENPQILHYDHESDELMHENMIFTIEPIITESRTNILAFNDGWTIASENNCRSAQFEHTIWIRKNDALILTKID